MAEPPEFAEEATRAERIRLVLRWLAIGAAIVLPTELWLLPALRDFSASAACRTVFGQNGLVALLYGSLVGLPVLFGLGALATLGVRGYRIIEGERFPLAGEKVFRPTRIRRGVRASLIGWAHLGLVALLFAVPILGYRVAHALLPDIEKAPITCQSADASSTGRASNGAIRAPESRIPDDSLH